MNFEGSDHDLFTENAGHFFAYTISRVYKDKIQGMEVAFQYLALGIFKSLTLLYLHSSADWSKWALSRWSTLT